MTSGDIPAEEACPYTEDCSHFNPQCPTAENLKSKVHCCWAARSWWILENGGDSMPLRNLVQKIRKITPIQGVDT